MRYITLLIFLLSGIIKLNAQFEPDRWQGFRMLVFPKHAEINSNPVFCLKEPISNNEVISNLNKKHPIYLRSGMERVPLIVIEINQHYPFATHAILKPSTKLKAGKEYELIIDSLSLPLRKNLFCDSIFGPCRKFFKVKSDSATLSPIGGRAWLIARVSRHSSCTMVYGAYFCICTKDTDVFFVRTVLKYSRHGKEYIRYIPMDNDNRVFVGRGNCWPEIEAKSKRKVWAKFFLMDASGNMVVCNDKFIKFKVPNRSVTKREALKFRYPKCKTCQ